MASESGDAEFQDVPRINVRLAAGDGSVEGFEEVIGSLKFASSFLRDVHVSPARARIVSVRGHSMHPVIPDGAVVLVNISDAAREPVHGEAIARSSESYHNRSDCEHSIALVKNSKEHGIWYFD